MNWVEEILDCQKDISNVKEIRTTLSETWGERNEESADEGMEDKQRSVLVVTDLVRKKADKAGVKIIVQSGMGYGEVNQNATLWVEEGGDQVCMGIGKRLRHRMEAKDTNERQWLWHDMKGTSSLKEYLIDPVAGGLGLMLIEVWLTRETMEGKLQDRNALQILKITSLNIQVLHEQNYM
ncbi:hypothetical protein K469DRAFT_684391 [Zopfia rhizophila CBS 207.26]|uniref:Uncharacterized protein n=1 Tax=Zopfia rhizophila CBS 207.26 TaxID=1314779 RepID=A0A6A6D751_9PEZI|nr:hypothetical protein K469DRAFT_684391 [Zopfia rhizophila CBS 207.26]